MDTAALKAPPARENASTMAVHSDAIVRAAALLLLAACAGCGGKADAAAQASPPPPHVQTVTARNATIQPSVQIAGVIAPYRQVAVTANLSEPLSEVDVVEGQQVRAGQVLARQLVDDLEAQLASAERVVSEDAARYAETAYQAGATTAQNSSSVVAAQDALHEAQVNLSGAQTDLHRYLMLVSSGYIPVQTVDQQRVVVATDLQAVQAARATLASAIANNTLSGNGQSAGAQQQDLEAARAAVDAAQENVNQLKREIARAVIVAPVDGVVDSVNANPGEYPSGRQLFTIEQNARVYAILPASTAQVVSVRRGAAASVEVNSSYNANPHARKDRGIVEAVLDQVEPGTTNFTVKVLVDNADYHLHAGMPVNGFVDLPPLSGVVIPLTAFIDDTRASVYTVEGGVVHEKTVGEVGEDGARAVVSGLTSGTPLIENVEAVTVGNGDRVTTSTPAPAK
jgi:multidrug efflux pump subunit AcrA (membrane-fusion protein)